MSLAIIKYIGGKHYLKGWLYEHFDRCPHETFVDGMGGGGTVVLNKKPTQIDVLNDIDKVLYNLYYHCKYNDSLSRTLYQIPCSKESFEKYKQMYTNLLQEGIYNEHLAIATIVIRRMSRGGLGRDFTESSRLRGGRPENINAWMNYLDKFSLIQLRMKSLYIYNIDFFKLLPEIDSPKTLIYLDPPYHPETVKSKTYDHLLTCEQHSRMLDMLNSCLSKVAISGYDNSLYREKLKNWNIHIKDIASHAGQTKTKLRKEERLWTNW